MHEWLLGISFYKWGLFITANGYYLDILIPKVDLGKMSYGVGINLCALTVFRVSIRADQWIVDIRILGFGVMFGWNKK